MHGLDGIALIGWVAQTIPACLLLFAGLAKLRRPGTPAQVIARLGAPSRTARQVAWIVITAELTFALACWSPPARPGRGSAPRCSRSASHSPDCAR